MTKELIKTPEAFRYTSKNCKYLDPKHKALAKRSFEQEKRIEDYYVFQSKIYDLTRWSFLFGRNNLLNHLPYDYKNHFSLLEVGCGTGHNLKRIQKLYPKTTLSGVDVSKKMLAITHKKVNLGNEKINIGNHLIIYR